MVKGMKSLPDYEAYWDMRMYQNVMYLSSRLTTYDLISGIKWDDNSFIQRKYFNKETHKETESITDPPGKEQSLKNLMSLSLTALLEPTFVGEIITGLYLSYLIIFYGPEFTKDAYIYMQQKGEKGWQEKSQNTDNPYKKWRKHDEDPNLVKKPIGNGNFRDVPKP